MTPSPRRAPATALALSVRVLPRPYRPRYRVELAAELLDVPQDQQLTYALRILARSLALRSALSTYRPTIGETLMASSSNPFNSSELRRRQQAGDVGHAVLGSQDRVASWRRWRPIALSILTMVVGIALGLWGPVPGLGMFLVVGGAAGLTAAAFRTFTDLFS